MTKELDPAIRNFLTLQKVLLDKSKWDGNPNADINPGETMTRLAALRNTKREARDAEFKARWLRQAKVISIPPQLFAALYQTFDRHTTELAGFEYKVGPGTLYGFHKDDLSTGSLESVVQHRPHIDDAQAIDEYNAGPSVFNQRRAEASMNWNGEVQLDVRGNGRSDDKTRVVSAPISREETSHMINVINKIGLDQPLPELMPFDTFFISLGNGIVMNEVSLSGRLRPDLVTELIQRSETTYGLLLGYLVVRGQRINDFIKIPNIHTTNGVSDAYFWQDLWSVDGRYAVTTQIKNKEGVTKGIHTDFAQGKSASWHHCFSLDPWIIPTLIDYINDHRIVTSHTPASISYKMAIKKEAKSIGLKHPLPPRFYTVKLERLIVEQIVQPRIARDAAAESGSARSFQGDVREHERVLHYRGPLPLSDKDRARLKKLKYRMYEGTPLNQEDEHRLAQRAIPPKSVDEWFAIKHAAIPAHRSPSNATATERGLVYIPALRSCSGIVRSDPTNT